MYTSAHISITGVVQGVGFRWFVVRTAEQLGITGWVRNRYDGTVEIEAEGTRGAVEALIKEVRTGPRTAFVSGVHVNWLEYTGKYKGFNVKF